MNRGARRDRPGVDLAQGPLGVGVGDAEDEPVGVKGVVDAVALPQELRVPRQGDGDPWPGHSVDEGGELVGGADRDRGLPDDQAVEGGVPGQSADDVVHRGDVGGQAVAGLRGPDADEVDVGEGGCLSEIGGEAEATRGDVPGDEVVQSRLVEGDHPPGEQGHLVGVVVDGQHLEPELGHAGRVRRAQVAGADDADAHVHGPQATSAT